MTQQDEKDKIQTESRESEPHQKTEETSAKSDSAKAEMKAETVEKSDSARNLELAKAEHEAIRRLLGLDKPIESRGQFEQEKPRLGVRPFIVLTVTLAVIAGCIAAWFGFEYMIDKQEEARFIAEHDRKLAEEEARHNRIEYADIAFLDSFPPAVAISMDGKQLYARSKDGSYTELRARESTWIQNLPIKESTVLKFGFEAEGFKPLTRSVAYYDWFPSNKPGANPLQKAFKKIVLEPDVSPRIEQCSELPMIMDSDPCEWTVFREIVFRERYANTVKPIVVEEAKQREVLKSFMEIHPLIAAAATGFDPQVLSTSEPMISPELPDATKSLLKVLSEHPYDLYGSITIETDSPDTRVFFMSEPLMQLKSSGSMSQVKVQPGEPYTFSVYGQGKPIEIAQTLSIRLETSDAPAYVAEISPHQWHCTPAAMEQIQRFPAPEIAPEVNSPDYRHYVCDYSIKISVNFNAIREVEKEAARQREAQQKSQAAGEAEQNPEAKKTEK